MKDFLLSRTTLVWGLLVGATLLSWELGHGGGFESVRLAGAAIFVITFIKVRFVILDFMELRDAPRWMRMVGEGWIVLICSVLIALFVIGSP